MNKIIFIQFVLITTYSCEKCEITYEIRDVCGTNGVTYSNPRDLWCRQKEEYGKRVNLQLKHYGGCWIWEKYGFETNEVLCISLIASGLIIVCICICRAKRAVWKKDKPLSIIMET